MRIPGFTWIKILDITAALGGCGFIQGDKKVNITGFEGK